ncbi:MAG: hypothetical protein V4479_07590 [Actinomycetota bacterium]
MPAITITAVNTSTDQLGVTAHGLITGDRFRLRNVGGALPAATPALAPTVDFFAVVSDANNIQISDTNAHALAGTNLVNLTGTGSGTNILEYGLPYCLPTAAAALGTQVKSVNDNQAWAALVAMYDLLTGQAQSLWSQVALAVPLYDTTVRTRQVTFAASGPYSGSVLQPVTPANLGWQVEIPMNVGEQILEIRITILSAASSVWKTTLGTNVASSATSSITEVTSSSGVTGDGSRQVITLTGLTTKVVSGTSYWSILNFVSGTGNPNIKLIEVDYNRPPP